ncbi:hypothetical protein EDB92DRAFT_1820714 [Lactarius akahatsu]|uniref:DUF6534 domain-containing protein n=1 Tax=Lactarius akahatsu TaxID=416441 RepID=A0AAD4L6F1_9AGAM|nr:hypothetical protein EDB92DRAFT_1820714 [Lactarius akahatsu]
MPAQIPVDNDLGVFFLGVVFSSILYGVIWLQVYSYFSKHCEGDGLFLKCFLAMIVHGFYVVGVTNFGDYLADLRPPWGLKVQGLIGIILTCSVQQFYAWRIYHLSLGQIHVPAFIVIYFLTDAFMFADMPLFKVRAALFIGVWGSLECPSIGLGIVYLVHGQVTSQLLFPFVMLLILHYSFQYPYFDQANVQIPNLIAGFSIQVACDLTITASMVYNLLMRHQTVVKRVFAIACLATIVRFTYTLIYVLLFFVLVRLYACAFMAVLNSRSRLRTSLNAEVEKGTIISFYHGTSTTSHVGGSDVTSAGAGASASNADAIGPRFATQSTISGISRTKNLSIGSIIPHSLFWAYITGYFGFVTYLRRGTLGNAYSGLRISYLAPDFKLKFQVSSLRLTKGRLPRHNKSADEKRASGNDLT